MNETDNWKLAVIVTDASQAANVSGGACEKIVRLFDLSHGCDAYIAEIKKNGYAVIELALAKVSA